MEFISENLLQKYEAIVNEINKEYENLKKLQDELNQETNSIVVYNLVKSCALEKLAHLDVKIFNSITEILNLYKEELEYTTLPNEIKGYKYYFIEIYISQELLEKLSRSDWFVVISVQNDYFRVSKSVNLPKKSYIIMEVISIKENVIESQVESYLVNIKNQMCIKLSCLDIDISYHFYKYNKRTEYQNDILQLTKLYNKVLDRNFLTNLTPITYQIIVPLEKQCLIELFLSNSYHNLGVEMFADLHNDSNKDFTFQICVHLQKMEVSFNKKDILNIKAKAGDLQKVKEYILRKLDERGGNFKNISGLTEIKNSSVVNLEGAITVYNKARRLSGNLPI